MSKTIVLKIRHSNIEVSIRSDFLRGCLAKPEAEAAVALYRGLSVIELGEPNVHDGVWLEKIAAWMPVKDGKLQPVRAREQARWLPLLVKLGRLKDTDGELLVLSGQEVEAIWARLSGDEFTTADFSSAWAAFVLDFAAQTGKSFSEVDAETVALAADSQAVATAPRSNGREPAAEAA